jgi:hypothetical protein
MPGVELNQRQASSLLDNEISNVKAGIATETGEAQRHRANNERGRMMAEAEQPWLSLLAQSYFQVSVPLCLCGYFSVVLKDTC